MAKSTPQDEAIIAEVIRKTEITVYFSEHSVFGRPGEPEICGQWEDAMAELEQSEKLLSKQFKDLIEKFNRIVI